MGSNCVIESMGSNNQERCRVGLIYDERMCKHSTPDDEDHPENPNRIKVIWDKLNASGIAQRFFKTRAFVFSI